MWVVERTAGNVVLMALQNVIGNVKIHHYNMHGCTDLWYAGGSLKHKGWSTGELVHSRSTTEYQTNDSQAVPDYIYLKEMG